MESTNWLALIVAAISALAVGFVWYNPKTFGTAWMKSIGMTEEDAQKGNMPMIFGIALVVAFLLAFFVYVFLEGTHKETLVDFSTFKHGAFHGATIGFFVAMPVLVTNALFEQKSFKYMAINVGYWVVTIAVMGGIVCAWR
jgi:predicted permease